MCVDMWSSLALKEPRASVGLAVAWMTVTLETSLHQKLRWIKGCSVLEETGLGQAFMGSDLAFPVTFSHSFGFMMSSVSWKCC